MRILAICGSLRAESSNMAVIEAAQQVAETPWKIRIYPDLARRAVGPDPSS